MLHNGDWVEEIATGRRGVIDSINASVAGKQEIQTHWRVLFKDGKEPLLKIFTKQEDFKLMRCPHEDKGEPGFYPPSIM
jgi:hypothetical protein